MFSAVDANKNLIDIDEAILFPNIVYLCPSCSGELVIKKGNVRVSHFAHKSIIQCDDYDNDMSEWHRNWQKKFPLKNREVVLRMNKSDPHAGYYIHLVRRTDVLCYGYAIEFQNSPITSEEFDERNKFYNKLEYKVVWIFNMIDAFQNGKIDCYEEWQSNKDNGGKFSWSYASKTFINYNSEDKNVILIFQTADYSNNEEDREQCYLEKVVWAINSNSKYQDTSFKRFFTSYYPGNFTELMVKLRHRKL